MSTSRDGGSLRIAEGARVGRRRLYPTTVYSVHFYHFDNLYFRYIKRHHLYHHSPKGLDRGYGLTSGVWDAVFGTRFPAETRAKLYASL